MADAPVIERDKVLDWRVLALTRAGVGYDEAVEVASRPNPYLLEELDRLKGCPPELIVRILG